MNVEELWRKADQAAASARLLLTAGDTSGTCNRAYYAMFDAARAALLLAGVAQELGKSHSGLIHTFSQHLVKSGRVPKDLGKASPALMNCASSRITPAIQWTSPMLRLRWIKPTSSLRC